jgi:hypothetical protein
MLPFPVGMTIRNPSLPLEGKYSKNEEDCKPFFMISAKLKIRAKSLFALQQARRAEGIAQPQPKSV